MPDSTTHTLPPRLAKIFLLPLLFMIVACDGDGASLRVFAASSLTGAFNDIALAFEAENPGIRVKLDFGGSQRMRSQLEFGAKADVFASADTIQMDALVEQDLVAGIPMDFALNSLVVLSMAKGPVNEIADLARPGVKVVLANDVVPVGSYSIQVLKNLSQNPIYGLGIGFKDRVLANRVSGEPNVGNLFQKVVLGEVDAGIVYETDTARSLDARTKDIFFISIPDAANVSARYPIAVLEDAPEPELAQQFVQFVLSNAGQTLLHGYGFSSP